MRTAGHRWVSLAQLVDERLRLLVAVQRRDANDLVAFENVDQADVRHIFDQQPGQLAKAVLEIERGREDVRGPQHDAQDLVV